MRHLIAAAAVLAALSLPAQAAFQQATVVLGPDLTTLTVTNSPSSTASVTEVVYSFGGANTGIATFFTDVAPQNGAPGATRSNFWVALPPGPGFFEAWQISTWSGLGVAPGAQQVFSGLIVRLIDNLLPGSQAVTDGPDTTGTSLANGSITVRWSDGAASTVELAEQPWGQGQTLQLRAEAIPVPAPAAAGLFALGLIGLAGLARRRA
jgi:hypothetical protein